MEAPLLRQLPDQSRTLLNKYYRAHRSHMRAPAGARCWVAQHHSDILAGLCLTSINGGQWLTGLLVAPSYRNRGLGSRLVTQALATCSEPIWLFCEPPIAPFYKQLSFDETTALPESLASRLRRYNRHKSLIALCHDNESAP